MKFNKSKANIFIFILAFFKINKYSYILLESLIIKDFKLFPNINCRYSYSLSDNIKLSTYPITFGPFILFNNV